MRVPPCVRIVITVIFAVLPRLALALPPWYGDAAPNWILSDPSGKKIELARDAKDQTVVLLFWATWCPYCRKLMPHLQAVADEFEGEPVRFYALNIWEDADPVAHLKQRGFSFELLLDAEPVAEAYGVKGTPGLFVLDRQHIIRYVRGNDTPDVEAEEAVREVIETSLMD
jgi:cytochrome c biogenesis protein CcmG/thiol:disulfide interchange protein DsbE